MLRGQPCADRRVARRGFPLASEIKRKFLNAENGKFLTAFNKKKPHKISYVELSGNLAVFHGLFWNAAKCDYVKSTVSDS